MTEQAPEGRVEPGTERPAPDPDALRRTRWLALASATAAVFAVAVAPIGLGLGVVTLVLVILRRGDIKNAGLGSFGTAVPLAGAIFAVVVGSVLTVVMVLFGDEGAELNQCMAGANTRVAEQRCRDEFMDTVERRINGWW